MEEIETKVLNVSPKKVIKIMKELGAVKIQETRLKIDWYRKKGWGEGDDEWFLRVRSDNDGKSEATWKGISTKAGFGRRHSEINIITDNAENTGKIFERIGLEKYAHQEKDRVSWKYKDWKFDMDTYPGMPTYLEIEVLKEVDIEKAIEWMKMQKNKTSDQGERILIQKEYGLNWYDMRF